MIESGRARGFGHSDHAARRAGEHGILAMKHLRRSEPAVRHHEKEPRPISMRTDLGGDSVRVAAQNGRQIGVGHRGVATAHIFYQRHGLVTSRDLRKAAIARDFCGTLFVRRMSIAVHEEDGAARNPQSVRAAEIACERLFVKRAQHFALRRHALFRFDHMLIKRQRLLDLERKELRPVLISDAQLVPKTAGGDEQHPLPATLEQRVRRDRCSDAQFGHAVRRNWVAALQSKAAANAFERRIVVAIVFGEKLERRRPAVRRLGDDVGKSSAAVDVETPGVHARSVSVTGETVIAMPRRLA